MGLSHAAFSKQYYNGPFEEKGLKIKRSKKYCVIEHREKTANWIYGVAFRKDIQESSQTQEQNEDPVVDELDQ